MSNLIELHPKWCQGGQHHEDAQLAEHTAEIGHLTIGEGFAEVCTIVAPGAEPRVGIMGGEDAAGTAWNLVDLRPHVLHTILIAAALAVEQPSEPSGHPWWCWRRNHLADWPHHGGDAGEVRGGDGYVQVAMFLRADGRREVAIVVGEIRAEGDGAWLRMSPAQAREVAEILDVAVDIVMADLTAVAA